MNLHAMNKYWPHWSMTLDVSPHGTTCVIFVPSMRFDGWADTAEQAIGQALDKAAAYSAELEARYP